MNNSENINNGQIEILEEEVLSEENAIPNDEPVIISSKPIIINSEQELTSLDEEKPTKKLAKKDYILIGLMTIIIVVIIIDGISSSLPNTSKT